MGKTIKDRHEPVWRPNPQLAEQSHMHQFMQAAAAGCSRNLEGWKNLYSWSLAQPAEFWAEVAKYTGIRFSRQADDVLIDGDKMPGARWFVGSQLNYAENLLANHTGEQTLVFRDERGRRSELTKAELSAQVAGVAAALRAAGLQPGDRVAAVLPNCPEAVIAMLGAASIGAVFSSCAPEFAEQAIINRFEQIEPRVLFVCDGYSYGGKHFQVLEKAAGVRTRIASIQSVVVVPFLENLPDIKAHESMQLFDDFLIADSAPEYAQLPFNHPLFILYSSGTTGRPKCIVHGAGGTLLQHLKELVLHTNLSSADTLFYYTNCGWMMWNWLVSALATEAKVVLYDGSPTYPEADSLWRMVAEERVTVFGTSPGFLLATEKSDVEPKVLGLDTKLHTILSTGAPLAAESFDYVHDHVGASIQLSSIAGGTDLISCFALGNPLLPVYRGELQCFGLGMAVEVFDSAGKPVVQTTGELVCTKPFPSMPVGFWNDPDGLHYSRAYFEHFKGVWAHGDLAEITEHAGLIIHGRADAVLNPGGVRIGSAEVCGPALTLEEVVDCIAVGQRWQGDVRIVLFVVLAETVSLDISLRKRIAVHIRNAASPRHVPAIILDVPEIPRTLSGKPVELAVRAILHGEPVENADSIANPHTLAYFRDRPELGVPVSGPESG